MTSTEARNLHRTAIIVRTNALADTVGAKGRAATAAWKQFDAAEIDVKTAARLIEQAVRAELGNVSERAVMDATLVRA